MTSVAHLAVKAGLAVMHGRRWSCLIHATKAPAEAQATVLGHILATNAQTSFGRRHGFATLRNPSDYRKAVPVQSYEDLRADIEAQELTGEPRLTMEAPAYYNRTSGTVAAPKNIPLTQSGLARIQAHQRLAAYAFSKGPPILAGRMFAVTGAAVEGHMPGGTPYGSASGLLYQNQSRLLRARYVLPAELASIGDYDERYVAMAAFGLAADDVTCAATPNSSTLIRLLDLVNARADELLRRVTDGQSGSKANPAQARRLRDILERSGALTFADIWPRLAGLVTWTQASCGVAARKLKPMIPADCAVIELGYVASEVHGSLNVDPMRNLCLPTLTDTFFEFAEREAWEADSASTEPVGLDALEAGRDYYVIVTTPNGLYRYDMNDIVRADGRLNETPTLEFVQKGKGMTSITGEKLHETQVLDAVCTTLEHLGIDTRFFIVLADQDTARYTLYLETIGDTGLAGDLAGLVDARLREANIEYDGKRASDRLKPLDVRPLPAGSGDAYRESRVAQGQRDAQFKYLHLQYAHECGFDFESKAR